MGMPPMKPDLASGGIRGNHGPRGCVMYGHSVTIGAMTDDFIRVARLSDFPDSGLLGVEVAGEQIVLVRTANGIRAFQGICTHQHAVLADGEIEDGVLWCPFHGAGFDVETGAAACLPATEPLRRYELRVDGEEILVAATPVAH